MSDIADDLIESLEAAGAGEKQRSHETGAGEQQSLREAGAGEKHYMHEGSGGPAFNDQSSNFIDSDDVELLSWLQYPLDDAALQHLPPLPTSPVLTSADFFSPSVLLPSFSLSSAFSSSLAAVKHFPQVQKEVSTVGKNLDQRAPAYVWLLQKDVEGEYWQGEQNTVSENQEPVVDYQRDSTELIKDQNGASLQGEGEGEHRAGETKAQVLAGRLLGIKQGFAKDSLSKLASYEERKNWTVRESQGDAAAKFTPHDPFLSYSQREPWVNRDKQSDINRMLLTTHLPQSKEEGGSVSRQAEVLQELQCQFANASHIEEPPLNMKDAEMRLNEKVVSPKPTERLQAHPGAIAALALGAGRAAGIIMPAGVEAFSKVRTSLQPTQPYNLPLGSPSSYGFPLSRTPSGSKSLYSPGTSTSNTALSALGSSVYQPSSQQINDMKLYELARISEPFVGFSNFAYQENQSRDHQGHMGIISRRNAQLFCTEPSRIAPVPDPQYVERPKQCTTNNSVPEDIFLPKSDTTNMQKLSGSSLLSKERSVAVISSGGSQTSGSLREIASGSKRKLEDLEGQSEETEGESGVSSQARISTLKSPRANEIHNISERKRRNRINDKMNALRELVPNASKSNKAALLDEAIEYLKNLQLQLQVLSSRTGMQSMMPMLPMPHTQIPQYASPRAIGMGNNNVAGGPALAAGGSSIVGNMGTIQSALTVPTTSLHHILQPFSTPAIMDARTLQSMAIGHSQALAGAQAHHRYAQPSHQMVPQARSPMYTIQGMMEHHYQQQQQQQHYHQQQQQQYLDINKRH